MNGINWLHALLFFALGFWVGPMVFGTVSGLLGKVKG